MSTEKEADVEPTAEVDPGEVQTTSPIDLTKSPPRIAFVTEETDSTREKNLSKILLAVAALIFAIAISWVAVNTTISNARLVDQNNKLEEIVALTTAQDLCEDKLANNITRANAQFVGNGNGLILIGIVERLTRPEGDPLRPALEDLTQNAEDAREYKATLDGAIQLRENWVQDGKPVPCPVNGDGQDGDIVTAPLPDQTE